DANAVRGALKVNAEGAPAVDGAPNRDQRWLEGWADVAVVDGRLTLTAGARARNNKIDFIDVIPLDASAALSVAASSPPPPLADETKALSPRKLSPAPLVAPAVTEELFASRDVLG
ncbi:MAG TPA: hypothetical protein VFB66_17165, partial [Tepidisphaeraceae bacterium]|nr:hypothetical protein [Tepidisphaeraceae bacterium]